jgi:hypothetical protein
MRRCRSTRSYVRSIKITFARDADKREQGRSDERRSGQRPLRARHLGNGEGGSKN